MIWLQEGLASTEFGFKKVLPKQNLASRKFGCNKVWFKKIKLQEGLSSKRFGLNRARLLQGLAST